MSEVLYLHQTITVCMSNLCTFIDTLVWVFKSVDFKSLIRVIWIPGHLGIVGNEKADLLAKDATQLHEIEKCSVEHVLRTCNLLDHERTRLGVQLTSLAGNTAQIEKVEEFLTLLGLWHETWRKTSYNGTIYFSLIYFDLYNLFNFIIKQIFQ